MEVQEPGARGSAVSRGGNSIEIAWTVYVTTKKGQRPFGRIG